MARLFYAGNFPAPERLEYSQEAAMKKGEVQTETGEMLKGPKPLQEKQRTQQDETKQQGGQSVDDNQGGAHRPQYGENRDPTKKKTGEF